MDDCELLHDYIERRSETAFAELVSRHVNLVYSTALRVVREGQLAQDVAQTVFLSLARKPRAIRDPAALGGWLYRAAYFAAAQTVRTERRRRNRESEAMKTAERENGASPDWAAIGPLLDEAMGALNRTDQNALVLRYFEGKSLRETGVALALSEDAAQKRVTRALEKLRRYFARRGVTASAMALAGVIAENSVQAAPTGLAGNLTQASLALLSSSVGSAAGAGWLAEALYMTTKAKAVLAIAGVIALVGAPVVWQQWQIWRTHEALKSRQADNARLMADVVGPDGPSANERNATAAGKHTPTLAQIRAYIEEETQKSTEEWQDWVFRDFLRTIPAELLPQAMGIVEDVASKARRDAMRDALLEEWAQHNATGAMTYAENVSGMESKEKAELAVLPEWVKEDPTAATAWVRQLPAGDFRAQAAGNIVYGLEPAAAWALYQDLGGKVNDHLTYFTGTTDPFLPSDPLKDIFSRWMGADSAVALAAVTQLPAGQARTDAYAGIAESWSGTNPAAAMAWAAALPDGDDKSAAVKIIMDAWSPQDATAAAQAAFSLPVGDARATAISTVVNNWADTDIQGAMAWVQQLPEGADKQSAQEGLALKWVDADPAAAMAYAQNLPAGEETNQVLKKMAQEWVNNDMMGMTAWVQTAPPGAGRNAAIAAVTEDNGSPELAQLVLTLPKDEQAEALPQVISSWAEYDQAGALAWLGTQPEGSVSNQILENIGEDNDENLVASGQWIQAIPPGATRDHLMIGYVKSLAAESADAAAQAAVLTGQIGDAKARSDAEQDVARRWLAQDPAAGAAWLATTSLPESTKQKLLNP